MLQWLSDNAIQICLVVATVALVWVTWVYVRVVSKQSASATSTAKAIEGLLCLLKQQFRLQSSIQHKLHETPKYSRTGGTHTSLVVFVEYNLENRSQFPLSVAWKLRLKIYGSSQLQILNDQPRGAIIQPNKSCALTFGLYGSTIGDRWLDIQMLKLLGEEEMGKALAANCIPEDLKTRSNEIRQDFLPLWFDDELDFRYKIILRDDRVGGENNLKQIQGRIAPPPSREILADPDLSFLAQ